MRQPQLEWVRERIYIQPMTARPRFIFFDVGNTLLFPNRDRILMPLRSRGAEPGNELLRELECQTKQEFDEMLEHHGHADHSFWYMFYSHLLKELGISDDGLRGTLVEATRTSANWDVMRPGTREALLKIRQEYRTAVISNADGKIRELLGQCGIAQCFESITDSGLVGCEKPDALIFAAALDEMNAPAEESLYVGDVYSVDYLGATRAGMRAMLFDVAGAYRNKGVPRVESMEELEEYLQA